MVKICYHPNRDYKCPYRSIVKDDETQKEKYTCESTPSWWYCKYWFKQGGQVTFDKTGKRDW